MQEQHKKFVACLQYYKARVLSVKCNATKLTKELDNLIEAVLWEVGAPSQRPKAPEIVDPRGGIR